VPSRCSHDICRLRHALPNYMKYLPLEEAPEGVKRRPGRPCKRSELRAALPFKRVIDNMYLRNAYTMMSNSSSEGDDEDEQSEKVYTSKEEEEEEEEGDIQSDNKGSKDGRRCLQVVVVFFRGHVRRALRLRIQTYMFTYIRACICTNTCMYA